MSLSEIAVPTFVQFIGSLSAVLDKAAAYASEKKIDPGVLVGLRLTPDMYPLSRQVQLASDFAKGTVARLAGVEAPKYPDDEKTIDELKARLAKTLAFVQSVDPKAIDGAQERDIVFPVGPNTRTLKGSIYLLHYALPQFYFHVTTAYNILRHCGVGIGKRDFIGQVPSA